MDIAERGAGRVIDTLSTAVCPTHALACVVCAAAVVQEEGQDHCRRGAEAGVGEEDRPLHSSWLRQGLHVGRSKGTLLAAREASQTPGISWPES